MKKFLIAVVVIAVLAAGAFLVLGERLPWVAASEESVEAENVLPAVEAAQEVVAEAKVVPVQYATLSLPTGGIVSEVLVAEGDELEAGQVLVRLASAQQAAGVAQAEAGLRRAQATLDELKAGPRPQEIAVAQASLEAAQAGLTQIQERARPEEVAAAEAAITSAQASLGKALEGLDEDELTVAATEFRRAEVALQQAQWAYDEVAYGADVGALPQAAQLEQATLDYEAALARYNLAVEGPTEAEVAAAQAQLAGAQASLAVLEGPTQAEVALAEAQIRGAQAQLDLVIAGARPETIAAAEADVAAAQAALDQTRAALADTELRAPFAGAVADLDARVGEQVTPGSPLAQLADFSAWRIETDDLTELGVVDIDVGSPVTIEVDAIQGLQLTGQVTSIKPIGENKRGDVTYTVLVEPQQQDERLRWNMTSVVSIEPTADQGLAQCQR
jgi:HlyD family secretion protein